ncbi:unnamed protein product [Nyctereutes procyonoides]|uniref:(raccoon dog) hypothetical protein n=1 Tax=Nyctereutes procyonoides TaxID=34880 RepID=A0A811ZYH4_NYCPR|nr:unnamed protein product [Nyctereutes procyonoides]
MAQSQGWVRRYAKAFCKGFFVAVPVAVTFLDRVACVARVEGASMQPSLNPGGSQSSDVVLLNHWKVRNFEVQRGDIVSLVSMSHVNFIIELMKNHLNIQLLLYIRHTHTVHLNVSQVFYTVTVFTFC